MQSNLVSSLAWRLRAIPVSLLLILMISPSVFGQTLYGSIVGNVADKSNAVVPGATVKITNKATNQVRDAVTNDDGSFNFPTVQTGIWEITVTKQGFKTTSEGNVIVSANNITRTSLAMEVGAVVDTVNVTSDAGLLQTDRAEVRAELNSQTLQNLPIPPGRNYQQLLRQRPSLNSFA